MTISALTALSDLTSLALLAPAFGASCALVFSLPDAPLSHPLNVIGGHLAAAAVGVAVAKLLPVTWWSVASAVGAAIMAMALLRVIHPPAAGNPIAVMVAEASGWLLLSSTLVGAMIVVTVGVLFHRATGTAYPSAAPPKVAAAHAPGDLRSRPPG